jgi:Asp-tRNA(Asn)/Glu-tRNA(Gln) amidotransferase A subunit family amidase
MSPPDFPTNAGDAIRAIRNHDLSATELVQKSLIRIAQSNPGLLAFTEVYEADARAEAGRIDQKIASGQPVGALAGVPVAVKDITPLAGKKTTLGSLVYRDAIGAFDPVYVKRLRQADAVIIGKTNTPEFAYSGFTDNRVFGTTRNPWHPEHTPGGSSGGAGAAVAAGHVPMAEGTDMAGSIRIPASYCGLIGLKPSLGRIPMDILPTAFDTISHFGPLTRTVEDAWRFLEVAKGPDESDPFSLPQQPIAFDNNAGIDGMRIAFSIDLGFYAVNEYVRHNLQETARHLRDQGADVELVDLPWDREIYRVVGDNWDVFIGAFHGHLLDSHRDQLDPETVAMMERAKTLDGPTVKRFELTRTRLWRDLSRLFDHYDGLLCPTTPITAPGIESKDSDFGYVNDQGEVVANEMTGLFNLVPHCPAISVPSGVDANGLPTGAQFVCRRFSEEIALKLARAVERTEPLAGKSPIVLNLKKE